MTQTVITHQPADKKQVESFRVFGVAGSCEVWRYNGAWISGAQDEPHPTLEAALLAAIEVCGPSAKKGGERQPFCPCWAGFLKDGAVCPCACHPADAKCGWAHRHDDQGRCEPSASQVPRRQKVPTGRGAPEMVPNSTNLNAGLQAAERRSYCDQCLQDTPNGCCLCDLCPACCKAQCEEQGHVPFAADGEHGNCHLPDTDEAHWDWRRAGPTRAKAFNNGGGAP